jgi:hypothetical protein
MSATTILAAYINNPAFSFETPHGVVPQWISDLHLENGRFEPFPEYAPERTIAGEYTEDGDPVITKEWIEWDKKRQFHWIQQRLKIFRQWVFFLDEFCISGYDSVGPFNVE